MATQQDLQDLLRLLTSRKVPMLAAMKQVKDLQAANLRSIRDIAEAPAATIQGALADDKLAKSLQASCKAYMRNGPKRSANDSSFAGDAKRARSSAAPLGNNNELVSAAELEADLSLPVLTDEAEISRTVILTNRAPLLLAFAVELARYTMPEQPLSSRLSLAQAVVSANARSKAASLGLEDGAPVEGISWADGQPRIVMLRRSIPVLKRGGYEWKGDEETKEETNKETVDDTKKPSEHLETLCWTTSSILSSRDSTFIAHVTNITTTSDRASLMQSLMAEKKNLTTATHNAWGMRICRSDAEPRVRGSIHEESYDDGETMCGAFILRILREAGAVNTLVVISRWFGGTFLGPDRWRLMRKCVTQALSERLRRPGSEVSTGGEALWALDLEAMSSKSNARPALEEAYAQPVVGASIHRPELARDYLFKSFASPMADADSMGASGVAGREGPDVTKKKKAAVITAKARVADNERNLSLVLGAIRLLYDSWADHLTPEALDTAAWNWYISARPDVESGIAGWGAKGMVRLKDILSLRRVQD